MLTCPKCHAGVPEGMRFCLQCGASLTSAPRAAPPPAKVDSVISAAPAAPPLPRAAPAPNPPAPERPHPPRQVFPNFSTVNLKIAPTPVLSPRGGVGQDESRPSLGDARSEIDEESFKKAFARPVVQPGAVVCRFCKGPLDLDGDFCEQCGAPVAEAAPPGSLKPKPSPPAPADAPPIAPARLASTPQPAAPLPTQAASTELPPALSSALSPAARPAPVVEPPPAPVFVPPTEPPPPAAEVHPSGFMGRLRGLFKKG